MTVKPNDAGTPDSGSSDSDHERSFPGFLDTLIEMSRGMGAHGLTVSVMVGGKWLTGEITTERAFLDYAVRKFATAVSDTAERFDEIATNLSNGAFKHLLAYPLREESNTLPEFLFLRDASCIDGNVEMKFADESILRIRIDAIAVLQIGRAEIGGSR